MALATNRSAAASAAAWLAAATCSPDATARIARLVIAVSRSPVFSASPSAGESTTSVPARTTATAESRPTASLARPRISGSVPPTPMSGTSATRTLPPNSAKTR